MSFATETITFYQKFISPFLGNNCRFYPSCSEYAKWVFENCNFFSATFKTATRLLRCNQFFNGGIDYPKIEFKPQRIIYGKKIKVKYWLIPCKKKRNIYYLVKSLKD